VPNQHRAPGSDCSTVQPPPSYLACRVIFLPLEVIAVWLTMLVPTAAQAPNSFPIPAVPDVRMLDSAKGWYNDTYSLYKCTIRGQFITCYIGVTRGADGFGPYSSDGYICTLTDNLRIDHSGNQHFLNGRDEPQRTVRLAKGEWAWLEVEFGGAAKDINSGNISCGIRGVVGSVFLRWPGKVGDDAEKAR
jgi:hypothetical protein